MSSDKVRGRDVFLTQPVQVGKELPDVTVYEGSPDGAVKISEACANKKCVIVGVPGAFTPTCSKVHSSLVMLLSVTCFRTTYRDTLNPTTS